MKPQTLIIHGRLPGMNDILNSQGYKKSRSGKRRFTAYASMKKRVEEDILSWVRVQGILARDDLPIDFDYLWVEPNRLRDKSNVAAGGRKFIEDALQLAKIIPNDGWKQVGEWDDRFIVDKVEPRIEVTLGADLREIRERVRNAEPGAYVPGIPQR